jgi:hypothetical protein
MEGSIKNRKANDTNPVSLFLSLVWTNIFWCFVLEITVTQNSKFLCVRRERKKLSKLVSDYINILLRTALTNLFAVRSSFIKKICCSKINGLLCFIYALMNHFDVIYFFCIDVCHFFTTHVTFKSRNVG